MLQANLASLVQKRLKILIGLVLVVLAPKDGLDELWVGDRRSTLTTRLGLFLEVLNVLESTQPAGNVSGRKRLAVESGHHTHHIDNMPAFRSPRLDAGYFELPLLQAE